MRALAINATRNLPGRSDATGAFIPEAVAYQRFHACYREGFDNRLKGAPARDHVESILRRYRDLEAVAFFCHGFRSGLQTAHNVATVGALADAIAYATTPRVVVTLYACSTAGQRSRKLGGFADALRDALTARGKTGHVDGHTVAGHAVHMPLVQRFDMGEDQAEIAGDWLVDPKDRVLYPRWRARLRANDNTLCWRFPFMSIDAIRAELRSAA